MTQQFVPSVGPVLPLSSGGGGAGSSRIIPLPVNRAGVNFGRFRTGLSGPLSVILASGDGAANPTGAYNGATGTGNKAIAGFLGFHGMPIGQLTSISYTWTSQLGLGGPFYNPPTGPTVLSPYCNLIVDFDPSPGPGDLRVLVVCDDSLPVSSGIGSYTNPPPPVGGSNILTYAWSGLTQGVLIVNTGIGVQRGVAPAPAGPSWFDNVYNWAALVAANPNAVLVDAFPATIAAPTGDGGMPSGATIPSIVVVSGDSLNLLRSGKTLTNVSINGINLLAA